MTTGNVTEIGFAQASVWQTAVSVGAGNRCIFDSCTVDDAPTYIDNDDLNDSGLRESPVAGNVIVAGDTVHAADFRQEPLMLLAAMMQGSAAAPVLSTTLQRHRMPWQPVTDGKFLTFAKVMGAIETYRYSSLKPGTRVIAIEEAGVIRETFSYLGGGVEEGYDASAMDYAVSPRDGERKRVLQRQGSLQINAQSGGALSASDDVGVVSGTITCERNHAESFGTGGVIEEPVSDDFGSITLALSFSVMTQALHDLFRDARNNSTPLKGLWEFTHDELMTDEYRKREFWFPKLIVTECPEEIPGPGRIPYEVTLGVHPGDSAPTGFDGAEPMIEFWQNEVATQVMT